MSGLSSQPPDVPVKTIYTPPDSDADLPQGESLYDISRTIRGILVDLKIFRLDENDIPDLNSIRYHARNIVDWITDIKAAYRNSQEEETIEQELADAGTEPETSTPSVELPLTQPVDTGTKDTPNKTPAPVTEPKNIVLRPNGSTMKHDHGTTQHQKPHQRTHTQRRQRTTTSQPSMRLVVRFPGQTIPTPIRPHPATLRDELNKALRMRAIRSIHYSQAGQLILHTLDPYTAHQIAPLSDQLWPVIQAAFCIADMLQRPVFEPDNAWTRIVVHHAPLPVWDGKKNAQETHKEMIDEFCNANSLAATAVRHMRWLCPKGEIDTRVQRSTATTPTFVSIMLALHEPNTAAPLQKRGVAVHGAHCRVTNYQERSHPHRKREDLKL